MAMEAQNERKPKTTLKTPNREYNKATEAANAEIDARIEGTDRDVFQMELETKVTCRTLQQTENPQQPTPS